MEDLPSLVRLNCAGLDPLVCTTLLNHYQSAAALFRANRTELRHAGASAAVCKRLLGITQEQVDQVLQWASGAENTLLCLQDEQYPSLLKEIPDPPPLLYVTGQVSTLSQRQIAIVGSRKATPAALRTARGFSSQLSDYGVVVTSGLAQGIDAAAHQGCVDSSAPTVAVLGNGPDQIYPRNHQQLQQYIAEHGTIVSEFPPGTAPVARNFPRRNRIISGLATGTLVVEAALKSGSLITARMAMEQNRDVYAIPGSIQNPLARGCHSLIQQGAKLVEKPSDILEEMNIKVRSTQLNPTQIPDENALQAATGKLMSIQQRTVLAGMGYDPTTVDTLAQSCQMPASEILANLLLLELNGVVQPLGGGRYIRC